MSIELADRQKRATLESATELKFWSWRAKKISKQVISMGDEEVCSRYDQAVTEYCTLGGRLIDGQDSEAVYKANKDGHMTRWCVTSNSPYGNLGANTCVLPEGWGASRKNLQELFYKVEQLQVWGRRVNIRSVLNQIIEKYSADKLLYGIGEVEIEDFVWEVKHD